MSVGQEEQEQEQEEGGEEEEERGGSDTYEPCQLGLYFVHLCPVLYSVRTQTRTRAHTRHTHTPDSYFSPCCNLFFQSIVVTY